MNFRDQPMLARILRRKKPGNKGTTAEQCPAGATKNISLTSQHFEKLDEHIRQDQALSQRAMTLANECSMKGWDSAARALAIDSVMAEPGSHKSFRKLGELLHAQGEPVFARDCLQGRIPDDLLLQHTHGSSDSGKAIKVAISSTSQGASFDRVVISKSEQISISPPVSDTEDPLQAFTRTHLRSAPTWVDKVAGGQCWHDANHTLVLDTNGQTLDDHTIGSEMLPRHQSKGHLPVALGKRVCLLGARGGGNYFHWMTDILPKLGICVEAGIDLSSIDHFVLPIRRSSFQLKSLAHLGIAPERIYFTNEYSSWISTDELLVPYLRNALGTTMQVSVPQYLQQSFLEKTDKDLSIRRKLFVSRDSATSEGRSIHNLEVVERFFMDQGYEIFYPERHSITEQAGAFSAASVVVGIHGAGMTNIVFCKKDTTIVEFYGEHIAPCYWAISRLLGLNYHNHCCVAISSLPGTDAERALTLAARRRAHFSIGVEDAKRVLEQLSTSQNQGAVKQ